MDDTLYPVSPLVEYEVEYALSQLSPPVGAVVGLVAPNSRSNTGRGFCSAGIGFVGETHERLIW